jgi:Amidohydrolase
VPAECSDEAAAVAREDNVFVAGLVAERPDRFGILTTVPLPDVEGAAREAVRALDELHADGLILLANAAPDAVGGRPIGRGVRKDRNPREDAPLDREARHAARDAEPGSCLPAQFLFAPCENRRDVTERQAHRRPQPRAVTVTRCKLPTAMT